MNIGASRVKLHENKSVELKKTSSFHFQELNWKGEWILFIIVIIIISIIIIIIVVIVIIQKVKI